MVPCRENNIAAGSEKEFRLRNSPPTAGRVSGIFLSAVVRSPRSVFYFIGALSYETRKNCPAVFNSCRTDSQTQTDIPSYPHNLMFSHYHLMFHILYFFIHAYQLNWKQPELFTDISSAGLFYPASPTADPDHFFQNVRRQLSACKSDVSDPAS